MYLSTWVFLVQYVVREFWTNKKKESMLIVWHEYKNSYEKKVNLTEIIIVPRNND